MSPWSRCRSSNKDLRLPSMENLVQPPPENGDETGVDNQVQLMEQRPEWKRRVVSNVWTAVISTTILATLITVMANQKLQEWSQDFQSEMASSTRAFEVAQFNESHRIQKEFASSTHAFQEELLAKQADLVKTSLGYRITQITGPRYAVSSGGLTPVPPHDARVEVSIVNLTDVPAESVVLSVQLSDVVEAVKALPPFDNAAFRITDERWVTMDLALLQAFAEATLEITTHAKITVLGPVSTPTPTPSAESPFFQPVPRFGTFLLLTPTPVQPSIFPVFELPARLTGQWVWAPVAELQGDRILLTYGSVTEVKGHCQNCRGPATELKSE